MACYSHDHAHRQSERYTSPVKSREIVNIKSSQSNFKHRRNGVIVGGVDFQVKNAHFLERQLFLIGSGELELTFEERPQLHAQHSQMQDNREAAILAWVEDQLGVDPNNEIYQK